MDKTEYRIKADEINELIQQGEYARAAEIADTIDWRRVRSVMMLCKVSDLYKMNKRYEDARDVLLLAYEHRQGGRTICYSLCELFIKMEDHVHALEFYKEYMQLSSPNDVGRYILKYKLYEAEEVNLEERIEVLEKLKECEPREKWMYELAYLYHRVGLATRCVEECDELILYFGGKTYASSKYVIKAMELKMLHQQLTQDQQFQYDHRFDPYDAVVQNYEDTSVDEEDEDYAYDEAVEEPQAETMNVGNTRDTRDASGVSSISGISGASDVSGISGVPGASQESALQDTQTYEPVQAPDYESVHTQIYEPVRVHEQQSLYAPKPASLQVYEPEQIRKPEQAQKPEKPKEPEDMDIQVKTVDVGEYNTINLQAELAAGLKEVLDDGQPLIEDPITRSIVAPLLESDTEPMDTEQVQEKVEVIVPDSEEMEGSEVFFGETGELADLRQEALKKNGGNVVADMTARIVMEQMRRENTSSKSALRAEVPKELASVLSQEPDGQISLVVPESTHIEKQITGQMNIDDILTEWERMKKENQEKRQEEVRQRVLQHTGDMFTEFEAAVRDGLLEKLESGQEPEGLSGEGQPQELFAEETWVEEEDTAPDLRKSAAEPAVKSAEADADDDFVVEELEEIEEEPWEAMEPETVPELGSKPAAVPGAANEAEKEPEMKFEPVPEVEFAVEPEAEPEPEAPPTLKKQPVPEPQPKLEEQPVLKELPAQEPQQEQREQPASRETPVPEPQPVPQVKKKPERTEGAEKPVPAKPAVEREKGQPRSLTREEKDLYAPFIQERSAREQLAQALDNISLASYTGNIIITGEEGMDTIGLAKTMIREMKSTDSNFSGKVAKISGKALNNKDIAATINGLKNGALIVQNVSELTPETAAVLHKCLQQENLGIILVIEDDKKAMDEFLSGNKELGRSFTARVDVEAMNNDALVAYGKQYAKDQEYAIDELGMLALHTRIEEMQTIDHKVTGAEVREIVDEAIRHANRKSLGHFFDVLFAKRYDNEDMIILGEKDFA